MKDNKPAYDSIPDGLLGNEPSPRSLARGESANRVLYIVAAALLVFGGTAAALVAAGKPDLWQSHNAKLGGGCSKEVRLPSAGLSRLLVAFPVAFPSSMMVWHWPW